MQLKDFNLQHDVRMLKTALVYGDKADIRSVASSLIIMPLFALGFSKEQIYSINPSDPEFAEKLIQYPKEYLEYEGVKEFLHIMTRYHNLVDMRFFGADGWGPELGLPEPNLEESMIFDFMVQLSGDLFSGETIPFFDEAAAHWASVVTKVMDRDLQPISKAQAKQIAIVSNLTSRLPLFEKASVDEILDIRKELEKPLAYFRSEIMNVSKEIETAPWNKDFPLAVEQLFIERCEPAILDIEDACKSNKFLLNLLSNFTKKPLVLPATSALGLVLSSSTEIPAILAQAISLITGSALIATEAVNEWKDKQRGVERNGLYFYYRLAQKLRPSKKTAMQSLKSFLNRVRRSL